MASKLFISAKEVAKELEVSDSYAYRLKMCIRDRDSGAAFADIRSRDRESITSYSSVRKGHRT